MSDLRDLREYMKRISVERCHCGGWLEPRNKGDRQLQCNDCRVRRFAPIRDAEDC